MDSPSARASENGFVVVLLRGSLPEERHEVLSTTPRVSPDVFPDVLQVIAHSGTRRPKPGAQRRGNGPSRTSRDHRARGIDQVSTSGI